MPMTVVPSPYEHLLSTIPQAELSVPVGGRHTAYWQYGDPVAPLTIVMVHGFRGDHHGLEPVVAHLEAVRNGSVRVLAPDLPGFGRSEPLAVLHDIDGYADWLSALLSALGLRRTAVVLGHSFGSIIVAAALAGGLPSPRAILVNPIAAPALAGPRGVLTRLAVFYYWLGDRLPERAGFALLRNAAVVRIMSVTMTKTRDVALRRWIHNQHDRFFSAFANRSVVLQAFRASIGTDVSQYAAAVAAPTLLIAAEKDDITPVAAQHALVRRFPQATLEVIDGVGHLIHYEVPEQAAGSIARFLSLSSTWPDTSPAAT